MCVTRIGRVTTADGQVAVVDVDGRAHHVPLVALGDEAAAVTPGDWLVLHTGLAVRRLDAGEAADLVAALGDPIAVPTAANDPQPAAGEARRPSEPTRPATPPEVRHAHDTRHLDPPHPG